MLAPFLPRLPKSCVNVLWGRSICIKKILWRTCFSAIPFPLLFFAFYYGTFARPTPASPPPGQHANRAVVVTTDFGNLGSVKRDRRWNGAAVFVCVHAHDIGLTGQAGRASWFSMLATVAADDVFV